MTLRGFINSNISREDHFILSDFILYMYKMYTVLVNDKRIGVGKTDVLTIEQHASLPVNMHQHRICDGTNAALTPAV